MGSEPFEMRVDHCWTITGRGTVVAGEIVSGMVRTGDLVTLVHAGERHDVMCRGVEMIDWRRSDPRAPTYPAIGLWLPEVERFDPVEGDVVTQASTV